MCPARDRFLCLGMGGRSPGCGGVTLYRRRFPHGIFFVCPVLGVYLYGRPFLGDDIATPPFFLSAFFFLLVFGWVDEWVGEWPFVSLESR